MSNQLTVPAALELAEKRFDAMGMASRFLAEKGFAMQLLGSNSFLNQAAHNNPDSLRDAVINIAAIGLSLNPAEKQAYLITRNMKDSSGQWKTKVFLEPSYVGLCKLATDSGSIKWVQARCVYEKDSFTDNGAGNAPTHNCDSFSKERGEFVGVYCVAKTADGDFLTEIMPADEVMGIMERSESIKSARKNNKEPYGPWVTDFREMAKKSVLRRAFKTWPRSIGGEKLAEAVQLSNANEGFESIIETEPKIGCTAEMKSYFDDLIEKSDGLGMFLLEQSLRQQERTSEWTSLYHSFPKGMKGKYQKTVNELVKAGTSTLADYQVMIEDAIRESDETGLEQAFSELPNEAHEILKTRLTPDEIMFIDNFKMTEEAE